MGEVPLYAHHHERDSAQASREYEASGQLDQDEAASK